MATTITIAEEVIKITVDGLPEAERKTKATMGRISKIVSGAGDVMAGAFGGVQMALAKLAVAGLVWKGFQGTREGEQFGNAMTYLARVVANEAAPALRILTSLIVVIADTIRGASPEVKQAAGIFAVLATVIAVLGGGPIGIAVAGLTALAVALVASSNGAEDLAKKLRMLFTPLALLGAIDVVPEKLKRVLAFMSPLIGIGDAINRKVGGDPALDIAKRLTNVKEIIKDIFNMANGAGPIRIQLRAELETAQGTWERVAKAMAEGKNDLNPKLDQHLGGIINRIGDLINAVKAGGAANKVGP